jgi:hypothetical protein
VFVATTMTLVVLGVVLVFLYRQWGVTIGPGGITRQAAVGHPPHVAAGVGPFKFEQHQPGAPDKPVAYDPCKPIHVVVNDHRAPPAADRILRSALHRVSAATGLRFVVDGSTHEQWSEDRPLHNLPRYGRGWSPVLVAWTTPDRVPRLRGQVAGLGGSTAVQDSFTGLSHYVTGEIALDTADLTETLSRRHGRRLVRAVVMHELGHVVGLAHVKDPRELMNPRELDQVDFGPGDREGLADLGADRCYR